MQPYFFPYAGYFRLFAEVDEFVIFDDVQFPRRGRVHRTETRGSDGDVKWLTLPIVRAPQDTLIGDLEFAPDARAMLDARLARLPWMEQPRGPAHARFIEHLRGPLPPFLDYLGRGLELVCDVLDIPFAVSRSSALDLDPAVRGQDRIIAIARALGATDYINAPGGVSLYDPTYFRERGIDLHFLAPSDGAYRYLLPSLLAEDPRAIAADVRAQSRFQEPPRP